MSQKHFFFFCILVLLGSSLSLAYFSRKAICIDSRLVYEIDRVADKNVHKVFRCGSSQNTKFDLDFYQTLPEASQRISRIESILSVTGLAQTTMRITLFRDRPFLFKVFNDNIYLGERLFLTPGHLEKSLIKSSLLTQFGNLVKRDPVFLESLSDLLFYAANGNLKIEDPITQEFPGMSHRERWPLSARSEGDTCLSPWKTSEQISICSQKIGKQEAESKPIDPWSYRAFYSKSLISIYSKMSVSERLKLLESFNDLMAAMPEEASPQATDYFLNYLTVLGNAFESQRELITQIRVLTAPVTAIRIELDHLFLSMDARDRAAHLEEQLNETGLLDRAVVGVSDSQRIWIIPQKVGFDFNQARELQVRQLVIESCEPIQAKNLLVYSRFAQKLLLVKRCNADEKINYATFVRDGIEQFSISNRDVPFVQIHLPSLSYVLSKEMPEMDLFHLLSSKNWEHFFFRQIGWQAPRWSSASRSYKALSNIDAIQEYRPPGI
jgi:hypothetical protein